MSNETKAKDWAIVRELSECLGHAEKAYSMIQGEIPPITLQFMEKLRLSLALRWLLVDRSGEKTLIMGKLPSQRLKELAQELLAWATNCGHKPPPDLYLRLSNESREESFWSVQDQGKENNSMGGPNYTPNPDQTEAVQDSTTTDTQTGQQNEAPPEEPVVA